MTSNCPACNKSVDPLRSRFVRVLGGKVVAYCSAECAKEPGAPVEAARASSPATGVPTAIPTPPRGVMARATPPAGVPVRPTPAGGTAARRTPASGVPVRPATPAGGVTIPIDSGPVIEIIQDASSQPTAAPERAKHPDEIPMAEFWSADKSQPVAKPASEASGAVKAARGARDDTLDKWTADTTDHGSERAASEIDADHDVRPRSRAPLVILVLLLLAGGGLLLYQYVVKNGLAAATHASAPAPRTIEPAAAAIAATTPAPREPPAPPPIDPAAAVGQARATLTASLTATSPRLARIAAAALARTEDPTALAVLAAHLGIDDHAPRPPGELGEIAKLDLAYSLARGHDTRGTDTLAAALRSPRGEVRDEAARLLALLGDPRGIPHLLDLLDITQRRLGAAEHLAHLAEPHAIKVLEQLRAAPKTSADDRARATIALGLAGRPAVAPALRDMLGDPHFNAFAAAGLAELKDPAAPPRPAHPRDYPTHRVRAARALRRLDPTLDARPVLARLLDLLKTGRDRDQVQAAEAILLLAGPSDWSTFE